MRPGDHATRRPGDQATRRPGDQATRRPGDQATGSRDAFAALATARALMYSSPVISYSSVGSRGNARPVLFSVSRARQGRLPHLSPIYIEGLLSNAQVVARHLPAQNIFQP